MITNLLIVDNEEEDAGSLYRQQFRKEVKSGNMALHIAMSGFEALDLHEKINNERPLIILSCPV